MQDFEAETLQNAPSGSMLPQTRGGWELEIKQDLKKKKKKKEKQHTHHP